MNIEAVGFVKIFSVKQIFELIDPLRARCPRMRRTATVTETGTRWSMTRKHARHVVGTTDAEATTHAADQDGGTAADTSLVVGIGVARLEVARSSVAPAAN